MPAPDAFRHETAQSAVEIVEQLDVMWECARDSTAHATPPASTSQLRLMCVVDRHDGIRMRTLRTLLAAAPPSLTRMCDRLQAIGFLERLPCSGSGREVTVRLSDAGKQHLRRIRQKRESMLLDAINAMPRAEQRALAEGLAGLHTQLTATAGVWPSSGQEASRPDSRR